MSARNIVVTGASSGVGAALVDRFRASGDTVFGVARNVEAMGALPTSSDLGRFGYAPMDLMDAASIESAIAAAGEFFDGRIDVICNVAGAMMATPIDAFDADVAKQLLQINFLGPLQVIAAALPMISDEGNAVIVNVSSSSATQAVPGAAGYSASKAAIIAATYSLAVELAPRKIRAVVVSPAGIETPMNQTFRQQNPSFGSPWYARLASVLPQATPATADEIAGIIEFAASPAARYWNGAELRVDGAARSAF